MLVYAQFRYDYIKNKYSNNSRLLFKDTHSLMYEIKTKNVHENFSKDTEMYKKVKDRIKNVVATISHGEYKDVMLDKNISDIL